MPERTSGYMTMAFHSGLLLGPPVGGVLIDLVGWRWVFFLLIPIALAGIALTILGAGGGAWSGGAGRSPSTTSARRS